MIDAAKAYVRAFCGYGQEASNAAAPYIAEEIFIDSDQGKLNQNRVSTGLKFMGHR